MTAARSIDRVRRVSLLQATVELVAADIRQLGPIGAPKHLASPDARAAIDRPQRRCHVNEGDVRMPLLELIHGPGIGLENRVHVGRVVEVDVAELEQRDIDEAGQLLVQDPLEILALRDRLFVLADFRVQQDAVVSRRRRASPVLQRESLVARVVPANPPDRP